MRGSVNSISLVQLELIDPAKGFAALRITAPPGSLAPYHISVQGWIGGGIAAGDGLHIDSGRSSYFHFSEIHTNGPNITIGAGVSSVVLDGNGEEAGWTYVIDPTSAKAIYFPVLRPGNSGK
jgi:hypothetical protein